MDQLTNVYKWTYASKKWTRSLVASYYYDGSGARAKTVEGATTTEYVYSGHDPICDKVGSAYTDYVYLNGRLKLKMTGTNSYWYIDDALGSTRLVYKGSTKVFSVTTYKPFGIAFGASGTEKFTFAGEMQDSPSGLFYLSARYYDPNIGRFVSMDPKLGKLSWPQSTNRYAYCANNPLSYTDPTGLRRYRDEAASLPDIGIEWWNDLWAKYDEYVRQCTEALYNAVMGALWSPEMLEIDLDLLFTGIGFIPVFGWVISSAYFIGKDIVKGDTGNLLADAAFAGACAASFGIARLPRAIAAMAKIGGMIDKIGGELLEGMRSGLRAIGGLTRAIGGELAKAFPEFGNDIKSIVGSVSGFIGEADRGLLGARNLLSFGSSADEWAAHLIFSNRLTFSKANAFFRMADRMMIGWHILHTGSEIASYIT